jgi:hypothetical protein
MAKIPPFSVHAYRIEALLYEGRRSDAIAYAAKILRTGYADSLFLAAVADLLEPPARKPGRPAVSAPADWFDIGQACDSMMSSGETYERAIDALAVEYGRGHRTVERAVRFYREGKAEADASAAESYEADHNRH